MSSTSNDGSHAPSSADAFVVPLDGSDDAAFAVPAAARLATAVGAGLELISVVENLSEVDARRREVDDVRVNGVHVERTVVVAVDPAVAICQAAQRPGRQLCMATKGRGRSAAVLGSVALGVSRSLEQPILCVGPRLGVTTSSVSSAGVLVCLDGSEHSEAALEPAAYWANVLHEPLTLVTAIEDAPTSLPGRPPRRWGVDEPEDYLGAVAARVGTQVESVGTRVVTDPLNPAGAVRSLLSREAATMVAAGTRGRGGIPRTVLGSVASLIVQHSAAPVLLVPAPT